MAHLSLELLGKLQVKVDDVPVTSFEYNKVRALLAYLALEADQPHQRDHLVGLLWPDLPERLARQNLSQALLNLREVIGDRQANPAYLEITRETIQFNRSSDYSLDVDRFKRLLGTCEAHAHRRVETCTSCARRLQQAVELYQGDFLAQFFIGDSSAFEEWVLLRREDLHQRALSALWRLAGYHEWRRSYDLAIQASRRQLELDPWREEAHRQLMRLLALDGQRSAALAQFEKCRKTLQEALGVAPEAETRALFELIRDHAGSESQFLHRFVAYQRPACNLPAPSTPLIGRQSEAAVLRELLLSDEVRLVSLTGTPGIGKTRLGIEVAASLCDDFEQGVFWVDLAALDQGELVVPSIAHALGISENSGSSPMARLITYLKDKQALLLLDNFEQVIDAALLIAEVLAACAEVKMLVTSRVPLRIRAERRYPLAPLPEKDAVTLFVERARAVDPEFQRTEENASLIRSMCTRLDGLPLAIELIAARVDLMPLKDLAAQLDHRLSLLTDGPRDLPQRQQTLRNAIDWSYALLSSDEQSLFSRLGVFVGGCTIEAVEAVCDPASLKANITGTLGGLIHKSLVQLHSGSQRYTLLETIRQYAQERLAAAGELERISRRHCDWCLAVAEAADREWREEQGIAALDRLEGEHDNLRAALHWCQSSPQAAEIYLQLARRLWHFWDRRSHFSEGWRWLDAAIRAARATRDHPSRGEILADALEGAGYLAWRLGDAAAAQEHLEEALELYQAMSNQIETASVLNTLGLVAWGQAEHARAHAYYEQSLDLYRQSNDPFGLARVLNNQGILDFEQGNYAAARQAYEQSLALMRQLDNPLATAWVLLNLGSVAHSMGDPGLARRYYEECLAIERQFGEKADIALTLSNLAEIAYDQGDYVSARALGEESLALRREVEDKPGLVPSLIILGRIEQHDGHAESAHALLIEGLSLSHALGNALLMASTLEQTAKLTFAQGKAGQAARLFAKAAALREESNTPRLPVERADYERHIRAVRDQLGEQPFAREWEQGRGLTFDQALAVAREANPR